MFNVTYLFDKHIDREKFEQKLLFMQVSIVKLKKLKDINRDSFKENLHD